MSLELKNSIEYNLSILLKPLFPRFNLMSLELRRLSRIKILEIPKTLTNCFEFKGLWSLS